ncbi:transposase, partial [Cloacibacillus evryensis]|nr:transposase [Cloacibacillus evryensis]
RVEKLLRAENATKNNAYSIQHGCLEYIKEEIRDGHDGHIVKNVRKRLKLDEEKAEADSRFDGYFCII